MTTATKNQFRNTLEARALDLDRGMRKRGAIVIETSADPLDQIQNAGERDLSVGNLERESKALAAARAALGRIKDGTFGICEDCQEEISLQRLIAIPWTVACIRCQEEADRSKQETWLTSPQLAEAA